MKPLLVNTYDSGGAANACLRLQKGLLVSGVKVTTLVKEKRKKHVVPVIEFRIRFWDSLKNKLQNKNTVKNTIEFIDYISQRDSRLELFSTPFSEIALTKQACYSSANIVNLHWVSKFLDYQEFFKNNTKPVVWTLHDMNPFSGGQHYEEQYLGMDEHGFPMQRKLTPLDLQIEKKILDFKAEIFENVTNLTIVVLCKWMADEVKKSPVFNKFPVKIIPNGIDAEIFKLQNKTASRVKLQLPVGKKVILFVADSLENERKGFQYLEKAFEKIADENVLLCAVGRISNKGELPAKTIKMGVINDESQMALLYAAADVFVIPSLIDNLPNTVVESLMCGTPVIGFPVGGINDLIINGKNGILAKEISVAALSKSIEDFLNDQYEFSSKEIRKAAVLKYDSKVQASAYISLFNQILKQ